MHALHLPFTGFFVGAFALVLICLIAWYSGNSSRQILQATLIVIMVKAAVSPHSPPPAYIAVAFQGLMGALLFRLMPSFRITPVLLGIITMVESALQKIIIATLIFGNALWQAVDKFFQGLLRELALPDHTPFSLWIIVAYASVYAVWGAILGWWIGRLPSRIEQHSAAIIADLKSLDTTLLPEAENRRKKPLWTKLLPYLALLVFIICTLYGSPAQGSALTLVLRTVTVLLVLILVVNPLIRRFVQTRLTRTTRADQASVQAVLADLPRLRNWTRPALALARRHSGFKRFSRFVLVFLVISLHTDQLEQ